MKRIRIVGCGSLAAGDDRLGLLAARLLRASLPPEVEVIEDATGGADPERWCAGAEVLVIVDAAEAGPGFPAGSFLRLEYPREKARLQNLTVRDTHGLSPAYALRLAENLGLLPPEVIVYALAGERFDPASPPSELWEQALAPAVEAIRCEVLARLR